MLRKLVLDIFFFVDYFAFSRDACLPDFFSKINNKNIDKFMPKCILYNADIYDSSPVTGKEFEILQKNNITPNYLLNRKGTKK